MGRHSDLSYPRVDKETKAGWVPMGDLRLSNLGSVILRPQTGDFQPFQGRPGREVESPLIAGKLLQLWSIREQPLQPPTFIKPPSPSSVTVRWGCLAGHSLIKSGCPKGPWRQRGGACEGAWREGGQGGRERITRQEGESKCSENARLFCYHSN